ncbi:hypothetical protein [Caloramator sp. ALD01]|uniref:hypothetical protein n=1 Tax=Caloramator sp. ALD01 TaxID=1031288 RepID=UPI00042120AB|nr:hypothetical protein [Caloramator sp. ALD01]
MKYNIENVNENEVMLHVDFSDEGVELQGETRIKGNQEDALKYLPVFEKDLRINFADKFPVNIQLPEGGELI